MTADELVRESTRLQGVPEFVEDPKVLARVASLMRAPTSTEGGEADEDSHSRRSA
jgi:hypothetical protein